MWWWIRCGCNTPIHDGNALWVPYSEEAANLAVTTSSSPFVARSWKVVCLSSFIAIKRQTKRFYLSSALAPPFDRAHSKENNNNACNRNKNKISYYKDNISCITGWMWGRYLYQIPRQSVFSCLVCGRGSNTRVELITLLQVCGDSKSVFD